MGADKADKDDACVVVNFDDEAVVVPFDIKNDSVAWENVGRWIVRFDRLWIFPVSVRRLVVPSSQSLFRIGMRFPEVFQGFLGNDAHD